MFEKEMDTAVNGLQDQSIDLSRKATIAVEIKEHVEEWAQDNNHYLGFLSRFIPVCLDLLAGNPSFISTSPEQKLRNNLLQVLQRFQGSLAEPLGPYVEDIIKRLYSLISIENEDNAILCIKICMDTLRSHGKKLAAHVQEYLDIVLRIVDNIDNIVAESFSDNALQPVQSNPTTTSSQATSSPRPGSPAVSVPDAGSQGNDPRLDQQKARPLLKSMQSFKVLAECPITVVSIFQAHRESVPKNVETFMPRVIKVLETQCPLQEQAHSQATEQKTIHYGVAKDIKNRTAFAEMVNAQVKTMSFLAYILRQYAQKMQGFLPKLPRIVVRMLRDCPKERCAIRRELLVAMRHLINFNFRSIFLSVIDDLLDERTLLGDSLTSYEALKPIAYSTLADLLHHVRGQLTVDQIRNTVKVYRSNLLGTVTGTSFQTMSAKLMMNMAECISRLEDKQEARYFFIAILDAAGDKFAAMNRQYPNALKASKDHNPKNPEFTHADFFVQDDQPPDWDEMDIFAVNPIKLNNPRERGTTPVFDNKFLFRTLVNGLKGVFYQLRICNPPNMVDPSIAPVNWSELACGFSAEEVQVLKKLLHEGTKMFQYYEADRPSRDVSKLSPDAASNSNAVPSREEKELLESFATIFHHVDLATFQEIFHSEIPHIHEMMFKHPALVQIPQFLLASEATSPSFAGMLLQFLMSRIEEVGTADDERSNILLRLFKLSFMAVTLFSQHNEQVLLPHVNALVTKSIKLSTMAEKPENYFNLLRSLFRSIGGGRFEHLYHEILPLLEMLLEVLNNLIAAARTTEEQDLYVELSLTVPARLSNLLPHLSYLMKPLVLALRAGSELVSQGLRTLELCVDNLTADYLDPIMAPVIDDLMAALWAHLKPGPYNHFHSHTTMRILGKLGGRNRRFLEGPPHLDYETFSDRQPTVDLKLMGTSTIGRFPAKLGLKTACDKIRERPSRVATANTALILQKKQAFKLVTAHIKLLFGSDNLPPSFVQQVRAYGQALNDVGVIESRLLASSTSQALSVAKRDDQQRDLREVLQSLFEAVCVPELTTDASVLLDDVLRHFAILEVAQAIQDLKHDPQAFDVDAGEGPLAIDHRVVVEVIADCLASNHKDVRDTARNAILSLRDLAATIIGSRDNVTKLPIFMHILSTCCHQCYMEEWWFKSGGAVGVNILATDFGMGTEWLSHKQIDIARALMYAAKDLPEDLPQATRVQSLDTLDIIIRNCNVGLTRDAALQPSGAIHSLCSFLVLELAHTSQHVRAAAQQCFTVLAELSDTKVHELIEPVKGTFLTTVFGKPLRALPYSQQIGYIDSVAYLLNLGSNLLQPSDSITRFLKESSLLAESNTDSMPGRGAPDQRHLEQVIQLKVSCLRLLSIALDFADFGNSPNNKTRPRVITIFFRSLYDKHAKVVDAANEALKLVVDRDQKLPKDVLQGGLRPILYSLQDASRLKLDNLHCLARLLQILKNYFKVEIGSRLLDNVQHIASTETLQRASFHLAEQNDAIKMVKAIFEIFHLLPPAANTFMDQVINKVIELEKTLRRTHYSPFREPLVKYLNRFAKEFWDKYHKRIATDREFGRFVAQIIADPTSRSLRDVALKNTEMLTGTLSEEMEDDERLVAASNIIQITHAMCAFPESRTSLLASKEFRQLLISNGKMVESRLQKDNAPSSMRLTCEQTSERIMNILTVYLRDEPRDWDSLLEVLAAVAANELKETADLQSVIYDKIIKEAGSECCKVLFERCLSAVEATDSSEKLKVLIIRYLLNPILAKDIMENWDTLSSGTAIVNKHSLSLIQTKLWRPQTSIDPLDDKTPVHTDHFRMELLQMTAMLLKYYHTTVAESRRDLVKFCWTWVRLEDVLNKWASYVVLAYFAAFYDTPSKIFMSIYINLISAHTSEARCLCTQALEIIEPVIPKIHRGDGKLPFWAEAARRAINDDPTNLQLFLSVFNFIGRHPDLFYEARETFSQMIISSIARVGSLPTTNMDNKKTLLGFLSLLWTWEKRFVAESLDRTPESPRPPKRKADGSEVVMEEMSHSYLGDSSVRMRVIKFLVQFIAYLPDRYPLPNQRTKEVSPAYAAHLMQAADVCRRSLQLLSNFLSAPFWCDLDIGTMFPKQTETNLTAEVKPDEKPEQTITRYVNTLQLVSAIVNIKSDEWVRERHGLLQKLLEKSLRLRDSDVQDCLFTEDDEDPLGRQPLIHRILQTVPKEVINDENGEASEGPRSEFVSLLSTVATEALSGSNVIVGVNILGAFAACRPEEIDQHVPQLMKVLTSQVKDHLTYTGQSGQLAIAHGGRGSDAQAPTAQEVVVAEASNQLILKLIDVLSTRVAQLGDNRRPFLTTLTTLIEKSPNTTICSRIVDLVASYVLDDEQQYPTLKEKNAVVLKMMTFEHRSDPTLFEKFLDIVIRIYEDEKLTRSELAVRLEPAFLIGTRAHNIDMRERFMRLFDRHLSRSANKRALYLICAQNWEPLCETFWLSQAIQLLLGATDRDRSASLAADDFTLMHLPQAFSHNATQVNDVMVDEDYENLMAKHKAFLTEGADLRISHILEPLCHLQHTDSHLAKDLWVALFPIFWSCLVKEEQNEMKKEMISLLTRDWHARQIDKRPNCPQALVEGVARCENPRIAIPHHLVKFIARTYNAWFTGLTFMESNAVDPLIDTPAVRESNLDALAVIYADLQEEDLFYGLWRRRSQFLNTNTALSYEQIGNWDKAQRTFESATLKARTGESPFSQGEYMLWEDHWVICAQKLQQWEILSDFAKVDNLNDLYLDAIWRQFDRWTTPDQLKQLNAVVKSVADAPTPRRMFFQSFMSLLNYHNNQETQQSFQRICDESTQLSIRKWHQLPKHITNAHIPILQSFQQLVELHDASVISQSLNSTTVTNLEQKAPELKLLLGTWRDRLPNFWDDINTWQDLVTWRRHIFQLINDKYLSLVPQQQNNASGNSFAYRGYHETAWTINKFAHVARKHQLPDVCINQLSTIYTLPNIEIQEAFLKLREQAKCHYHNPSELQIGLEVINNTNLNYFGNPQKAEFYTLKGMFLARQNQTTEANEAFSSALGFELKLAKAWVEWGRYNEQLFRENPSDMSKASSALSCYLEAAGTHKNGKSRKSLSRVLWLLSLDDVEGSMAKTFDNYKGETPVWYWITFIPQLLVSISKPEARIVRSILLKLAKQYPQALYYHLRTTRDDFTHIRKQHELKQQKGQGARATQSSPSNSNQALPSSRPGTANGITDSVSQADVASQDIGADKMQIDSLPQGQDGQTQDANAGGQGSPVKTEQQQNQEEEQQSSTPKQPWEYIDEITSVLKTGFPLLALSMETMVDQISRQLKASPDEEAYRLIVALFNDALNYISRAPKQYAAGSKLPQQTEANLVRFADSILPPHIRGPFEADFVNSVPDIPDYITKLRKWRDRFEEKLDRRHTSTHLEAAGPHLVEFKFHKFDEVEVPGQYLLHRDKNTDFVRIERFLPDIELVRASGICFRKLRIRGHDGSIHSFLIQHPTPRTCRREERMTQMFRFFNDVLNRYKETRRRKLQFTLPVMVPMTPAIRMIADDPSSLTLQTVYEDHCRKRRLIREDPTLYAVSRLRELASSNPTQDAVQSVRLQVFEHIQRTMVPDTLLLQHFQATHRSFDDFWLFRRQAAYQLACHTFMTFVLFVKDRVPSRVNFSRATGNVWGSEMTPSMAPTKPLFANNEAVQIRLTPNLQTLMGPVALEGVFTASVLVVAKALSEPYGNLTAEQTAAGAAAASGGAAQTNGETKATTNGVSSSTQNQAQGGQGQGGVQQKIPHDTKLGPLLSLFVRDEVSYWHTQNHKANPSREALRDYVEQNSQLVAKRAVALAKAASGPLPANQTVVDLVSKSVMPRNLALMEGGWMGWL